MTIWPPRPGTLKRPAYRYLAQAVVSAIETGALRPGDRLPTHRELAYQLGLSVQTVSRAYEELIRIEMIVGEVGRGTFVSTAAREAAPPYQRLTPEQKVIDCSMLTPIVTELHTRKMSETLGGMASALPDAVLQSFRPQPAHSSHMQTALAWLQRCGVRTASDCVIMTNGSTSAMTVALTSVTTAGDLVATEAMGHHTLPTLARTLGLRLAALPMDHEGILPEALDNLCRATQVKTLYTMPAGLNALACTMGNERRDAICAVARHHGLMIVENDAWGPLEPHRPAPLVMRAPERTLYFTGLSKCLLPGLRVGYLVVPPRLAEAANNRHLATSWMATALMGEIGARWIAEGTAEELLHWQRRALARRCQFAADRLGPITHRAAPRGLHIWIPLSEPGQETAVVARLRERGLAVAPGNPFALDDATYHPGIRFCVGNRSEKAFETGIDIVATLLGGPAEQGKAPDRIYERD
ncbi:PLP-dependent aminotransferase family protein [Actibacterium sp.]|uniref:MocR-like ectoine utilization transcription factor EhuR n=1 Tax=Actibacterium sp. TaxID=1872125 RepID=UPI002580369A|nr:PLP-dependent aminotransferase family protein [Actibacterium sp.]